MGLLFYRFLFQTDGIGILLERSDRASQRVFSCLRAIVYRDQLPLAQIQPVCDQSRPSHDLFLCEL